MVSELVVRRFPGVCTSRLATVVVHVDDPAPRRDQLGDLVSVASGRQAGTNVEELPDPRFFREVPHGAAQERPRRESGRRDNWGGRD